MSRYGWIMVSLVLANLASGVAVIYATYDTRQHFSALQQLENTSQQLKTEYSQLLLEKSAWAASGRVEQKARTELGMIKLDVKSIKILGNQK